MTFSIVARADGAFGVAVASRFLAVGSIVPNARVDLGAVATQAFAKVGYRHDLLDALAAGRPTEAALADALDRDPLREQRQVGLVGLDGATTHTGADCMGWAGGVTADDGDSAYAIQGNILTGPEVVQAMEQAWLESAGRIFTERLLAALLAGDAAGGDRRGRQSAAVYAVRAGAGYDESGVLADLRVDDHTAAASELVRLADLAELYFGGPEDVQPLQGDLAEEVGQRLKSLGLQADSVVDALSDWAGEVNLETRLTTAGIDARVLQELRRATGG